MEHLNHLQGFKGTLISLSLYIYIVQWVGASIARTLLVLQQTVQVPSLIPTKSGMLRMGKSVWEYPSDLFPMMCVCVQIIEIKYRHEDVKF